jgi:hypothetical protein
MLVNKLGRGGWVVPTSMRRYETGVTGTGEAPVMTRLVMASTAPACE